MKPGMVIKMTWQGIGKTKIIVVGVTLKRGKLVSFDANLLFEYKGKKYEASFRRLKLKPFKKVIRI